jgi:hypothetical protein
LQRFYAHLQAVALDRDTAEEVVDLTLPPVRAPGHACVSVLGPRVDACVPRAKGVCVSLEGGADTCTSAVVQLAGSPR